MHPKSDKPEVPARQFGLARDIRRLKADSADAAAELSDFLRQFRGKPPQEVLGLVAQSGLVRATGVATVATVLLMAVFTVVPYFWHKAFPKGSKVATQAAAALAPAVKQTPTDAASNSANPTTAAPADPNKPVESEEFAEQMGIETVESDPASNPLEESADDLLNDIK